MSLAELIEVKKEEAKKQKAQEKENMIKTKEAAQPATKFLNSVIELKGNLKADKLPPAMLNSNPIDSATDDLREAIKLVKDGYSPSNLADLEKKLASARLIAKSMKAFV